MWNMFDNSGFLCPEVDSVQSMWDEEQRKLSSSVFPFEKDTKSCNKASYCWYPWRQRGVLELEIAQKTYSIFSQHYHSSKKSSGPYHVFQQGNDNSLGSENLRIMYIFLFLKINSYVYENLI